MSQPVVVTIPHHLGRAEASRRLKTGLARVEEQLPGKVAAVEQAWSTDDHLDFRLGLLGQTASGTIDVAEDHVRLEVQLPWLLAQLAGTIKTAVEKRGQLLLEKK
jgi:cytochrome bd-type quinol oxidase subunit 1